MYCPFCLDTSTIGFECSACSRTIDTKCGIPSVTSVESEDEHEHELRELAAAMNCSSDDSLRRIRETYMDGRIVDRLFKTRTVCWRFPVSAHLSGTGLVVGDHEDVVAPLLAETLEDVYVVDTNVARLEAQVAVASAEGSTVNPLHAEVETLPFPSRSFDVIVLRCRAHRAREALSAVKEFLAADGSILLLVDGWTRELGITTLVGMGDPPTDRTTRVRSAIEAHAKNIFRAVQRNGLSVEHELALLSTDRHENERVFDTHSRAALDWLLYESEKAVSSRSLTIARSLSRVARDTGVLGQCYPRYLFVCRKDEVEIDTCESILLAGKNRSTVIDFENESVDSVRKIPNSLRQSSLHRRAREATAAIEGRVSETLPRSEHRQSQYGIERHERPVEGTTMNQSMKATPASFDRHVTMAFDWLESLQRTNVRGRTKKRPETIRNELTDERFDLSDPPIAERSVELPTVVTHGDFFGSNIYHDETGVSTVIDWEWARLDGNPITDAGFFVLQFADFLGDDFETGFETLFLEDGEYTRPLYETIRAYCDAIGIDPYVFSVYLPIGYIERSRADLRFNKRLDIDWPSRVRDVWRHSEELTNRITQVP